MKKDHLFRFAVASDGHYGEPGTSLEKNYENLVKWMRQEKDKNGLDLWFFNGDLVHDREDFLPRVKSYFDRVNIPYFVVKGNHDTCSPARWKEIFGYPEYFIHTIHDISFLGAPTSDPEGNYLCADTGWLREQVRKCEKSRWIFLFLHVSQGGWTKHGIHCPDVMQVLDKLTGITGVFHGHDHQEDGIKHSENTAFLFDGYIGGSWGPGYHGYRIVEIKSDRKIYTYQFNPGKNRIMNENYL